MTVAGLIGNPVALVPGRPYGAILGASPSKGARSPILWRAAFAALGMDADFHPFDVTPDRLEAVVAALREDADFIGGAVAVPFKEALPPLLDGVDPAARAIGAVNALRRGPDGGLWGANTDGSAAVGTLRAAMGDPAGRTVIVLGCGGAGKAVAGSLAVAGAKVLLWNRDHGKAADFAARLAGMGMDVAAVTDLAAAAGTAAALVNATSVGFRPDSSANGDCPVAEAVLQALPAGTVVFDIVYQPERTALLAGAEARGLTALGGRPMNLRQAVEAFCLAFPAADGATVAAAMAGA